MQSIQPDFQTTTANGTSAVDIVDAPAAGKTRMVVALRYKNGDSVTHTPFISRSSAELERISDVGAGTTAKDFCDALHPIHLRSGVKLVGDQVEATTATEPTWQAEFYEGTDS